MNISATITIPASEIEKLARLGIRPRLGKALQPVNLAMAKQFQQCTYDNFGASGSFRPFTWAKLSPGYARKVNRDYATLFVSGKLKSAIKATATDSHGRVSVNKADCIYALAHQFGNEKGNLPARPYLPIRNGAILGSVKTLVERAAALALTAALRK